MTDAEKALALATKIDAIADEIVRNAHFAISVNCGDKPEFMAIMLGAVHAKIGRLLVETEQKVRTDG